MLHLTWARGCSYEGITVANPAEHGIYLEGPAGSYRQNRIQWVKNISWRVNNDGGGVTGNGIIEDCFFRHQDDALYIRGVAIRRCVLWSAVNGTPLRCSFITNDMGADFPPSLPQDLIVEDCDIIYARGVFGGENSTDFGVIATPGGFGTAKIFTDGTTNTGQHILLRNIRISDPRPVRSLFAFDATKDAGSPQLTPWKGLRFENIDYQHPQTWGWKNRLLGSPTAAISHWTFDRVSIAGQALGPADLTDPAKFETDYVSEMIFR